MAAAAVGLPLYYGANKLISQAAERELNGMQRKFDKAVEAEIAKAESLAALVAMEPDVRQAMAAGDRDALSKAFVGGFDTMRSVYGFEQLQFHTPDAHAFFRVHSPTKFGDDLSSFRRTVIEANRTHKPVVGLERGQAGVGVRAIYPISSEGKPVGSMEFGLGFGKPFLDRLTDGSSDEGELYIFPMDASQDIDATKLRTAATSDGAPLLDASCETRRFHSPA
ncbi:hypothetical protein PMI07_005530 [Rhizobium sp. CF080]|uniref:cache domain-containing protein n=1 Tax=Rhizobium sp. (strain CF080) TaxID=1144310 RepID=UPI00027156F0|nr:cache domain-containing protein [Rhizobium sp. CF080]EUB99249.1 hypothetical protein PMI07_005530 [Rhizobium sp. CF080]